MEGTTSSTSGLCWEALEEVIAHDSVEGEGERIPLEVHLLVSVLIQITHHPLRALLIHLLLKVRDKGVITRLLSRVRAQLSLHTGQPGMWWAGSPWEPLGGPVSEDREKCTSGSLQRSLLGVGSTPGIP